MSEEYVNPCDTTNASVLPAKRKKSDGKRSKVDGRGRTLKASDERLLSKKKRRALEAVVRRKEKKANRSTLLESLQEFQVDLEKLRASRASADDNSSKRPAKVLATPEGKLNAIGGSRRKLAKLAADAGQATAASTVNRWQTGPYFETDSSGDEEEVVLAEDDSAVAPPSAVEVKDGGEGEPDAVELAEEPPELIELKENATAASPAVFVRVRRPAAVAAARVKLPIVGEEQAVVEAVRENDALIVCGETGSGKTTQVPQFLFEAGFAEGGRLICVTEPRRVAAVSMAARVAYETGLGDDVVSYQIRYEGNATERTRILFMTDGVLLRELKRDITLARFSVIIIDEAHERSVYSDILIGLLSRIAPLRTSRGSPLKLIVMSATLRVDDFTSPRLFKSTPRLLKVESRQFPVSVYFNKHTPDDYLGETFKRVCKIHKLLPPGGILVFLSGQMEVNRLLHRLRSAFPVRPGASAPEWKSRWATKKASRKVSVDLSSYSTRAPVDLDEIGASEGGDSDDQAEEVAAEVEEWKQPLFCLPLYSLLPTAKQRRVFAPPPDGARLCVVATNVAETSLTIPDVRYVVDSGKEKQREYDPVTGASRFRVAWVSQASADQRAGRAGRTAPGHCYRLYSSAVFAEFDQFAQPDILKKPVDALVLQMKAMNIVKVHNFPFPSAPDADSLRAAEERLVRLGALQTQAGGDAVARVAPLGRLLTELPVSPPFGRLLVWAAEQEEKELLAFAVCVVAALSVREPLLPLAAAAADDEERWRQSLQWLRVRRQWAARGESLLLGDVGVLLKAVGAAEFAGLTELFCSQHGLRHKAFVEIRKMRKQLTDVLNVTLEQELVLAPQMRPPTVAQAQLLRKAVLTALAENVARRADSTNGDDSAPPGAYYTQHMQDVVYIHPSSVLYKEQPEWVVFVELLEHADKKLMQGVCAVEPAWLPQLAAAHCRFGAPVADTQPSLDAAADAILQPVACTFGRAAWPLGAVARPLDEQTESCRWFAAALLDGAVVRALGAFGKQLLAPSSAMTRPWGRLQARVQALLAALSAKRVHSRRRLLAVWNERPDFLLAELLQWLPQSSHDQLRAAWPPVQDQLE